MSVRETESTRVVIQATLATDLTELRTEQSRGKWTTQNSTIQMAIIVVDRKGGTSTLEF